MHVYRCGVVRCSVTQYIHKAVLCRMKAPPHRARKIGRGKWKEKPRLLDAGIDLSWLVNHAMMNCSDGRCKARKNFSVINDLQLQRAHVRSINGVAGAACLHW